MLTEGGNNPQFPVLERLREQEKRYGQQGKDLLEFGIDRLRVGDPDVPVLLREYEKAKNPTGDVTRRVDLLTQMRAKIFRGTTSGSNKDYLGWFAALTALGQELAAVPPPPATASTQRRQ
jgi:hypothetical protein